MDKMRMETPDITERNIERIGELFPNCITEAKGEDGKLKKAINFDMLRQMLSDEVLEGDARHHVVQPLEMQRGEVAVAVEGVKAGAKGRVLPLSEVRDSPSCIPWL